MSADSPSQRNQIGAGCGVPTPSTTVSQATTSSSRRRATRAPNSVDGSGSTLVIRLPVAGAHDPVVGLRQDVDVGARAVRQGKERLPRVPGPLPLAHEGL